MDGAVSITYRVALVGALVLRGIIGIAGGGFLRLFVQGFEERIVEKEETGRSKPHFFATQPDQHLVGEDDDVEKTC